MSVSQNDNPLSKQERLSKLSCQRTYNLQSCPKIFQELLSFMNNSLKKQFKSFSFLGKCCGGDRMRFLPNPHFQRAFNILTQSQKMDLYEKSVRYAKQVIKAGLTNEDISNKIAKDIKVVLPNDTITFYVTLHMQWRSSQEIKIRIQGFKLTQKDNMFSIDLQNYILRKSKKESPRCYILESIRQSDPQNIRFSFSNRQEQEEYLQILRSLTELAFQSSVKKMSIPNDSILLNTEEDPFKKTYSNSKGSFGRIRMKESEDQEVERNSNSIMNIDLKSQKGLIDFSKSLTQSSKRQRQAAVQKSTKYIKTILNSASGNNHQNKSNDKKTISFSATKKTLINVPQQPQLQVNLDKPVKTKKHKYIFKHIFPEFDLKEIDRTNDFTQLFQMTSKHFAIFRHKTNKNRFKLNTTLNVPLETLYKILINCELLKNWNRQILESQIKIPITTQNCLICYQKHKKANRWFKNRDYIYLRHAFTQKKCSYVVDRSIEHSSFFPFSSIQRAQIDHQIIQLYPLSHNKTDLLIDLKINHGGMLGENAQKLSVDYLQQYSRLEKFILNESHKFKCEPMCNLNWNVDWIFNTDNKENLEIPSEIFGQEDFLEGSEIQQYNDELQDSLYIDQDDFKTVQEDDRHTNRSRGVSFSRAPGQKEQDKQTEENVQYRQVSSEQYMRVQQKTQDDKENNPNQSATSDYDEQLGLSSNRDEVISLNQQGKCILPQQYIMQKHVIAPKQASKKQKIDIKYKHIVLKDDFVVDKDQGIKLINKKKSQAQDNVFKFIMKTMKNNLFSGKSLLSISLPVQIFKEDSNTQRLCESMALGPLFLQRASQSSDLVERMKQVICFGLSNSLLYFYIEKPFNPILGQTYQGYIDGCPIYAQQISHHPPIASIYFVGRGYKVSVSLQSKVFLHVNSADGVNQGYYKVQFDNGQVIMFQTAPGELSGLTIGQRRYRFKDRMYVFDPDNCLYSQVFFDDPSKSFFSKSDWSNNKMKGDIVKVSKSFMQKFIQSKQKIHPKSSMIENTLSKVEGNWLQNVRFDGKVYYDIVKDLPFKMVNHKYSLNSDAKYREDLIYRTKNDLLKSQTHKQYLQIIQRKDRKLREQYHGKKH